MQLTYSLLIFVAATVTSTFARCSLGFNYCGHTLLEISDYNDQMSQEAYDKGHGGAGARLHNLYKCVDEGDRAGPGVIQYIENCDHGNGWYCSDNGGGNNDSCQQER